MRKIERQMLDYIAIQTDWREGNTEVHFDGDRFTVALHGNVIFEATMLPELPGWWDPEAGDPLPPGYETGLDYRIDRATLAGWDTQTTRSRLRALGVDVQALREAEGYVPARKRKANPSLSQLLADPETKENLRALGA